MRKSTSPESLSTSWIFLCAFAAFLADFLSKSWAAGLRQPLEAGHFALAHIGNDALMFSLGGGGVPIEALMLARLALFALCAFVAVRCVTFRGCERLGFALIAAGGLGNLVDLPLRGGAVVDFIGFNPVALFSRYDGFHIFFNLADLSIFAGVALALPVLRAVGLRVQRRFHGWLAVALRGGSSARGGAAAGEPADLTAYSCRSVRTGSTTTPAAASGPARP